MNNQTANRIYDILVEECGANDRPDAGIGRSHFVDTVVNSSENSRGWGHEYRFQGELGFGGKFYDSDLTLRCPWSVSCYSEDQTPERKAMIDNANERLRSLWEELTS